MPVVLAPLVVVGVALLLLLIALAFTVIFTPIIEGVLRQIPYVGGVIANKAKAGVDWAQAKVVAYANTGASATADWITGLGDSYRGFVEAVNAYMVDLVDQLDHLTHVTVHEIVKAFVNPVRATATAAKDAADRALAGVESTFTLPLHVFRGIEGDVNAKLDVLHDVVKNVDLPGLHRVIDQTIGGAVGTVEGELGALTDFTDKEFQRVWDQLGKVPLEKLLELLRSYPALAAMVGVIAIEAGLESAACRQKVKHICTTDLGAWQALLDVAGIALVWMGLREFVQLAQDFARETLPPILETIGGG